MVSVTDLVQPDFMQRVDMNLFVY